MLTGKPLGAAIKAAIKDKRVTQKEVARVFGVKPPSISDWINKGTISKDKLPKLWDYFADVVGPAHWGLAAFPDHARTLGEPVADYTITRVPRVPKWEAELLEIARRLDSDGRQQLIGMAKVLASQTPPPKAKAVS